MTMDDARTVLRGCARDCTSQLWPKAFPTPERDDVDVVLAKPFAPCAFLVETAHSHRELWPQALDELDDEPLRAARVQAEDDLQDIGTIAVHLLYWLDRSLQEQGFVQPERVRML